MATGSIRLDGVIRRDELYTLPELKKRLGIQDRAWWSLKEQGLRTVRAGSRTYILGKDVIELFERLAGNDPCQPESRSSHSLAATI